MRARIVKSDLGRYVCSGEASQDFGDDSYEPHFRRRGVMMMMMMITYTASIGLALT